MIGYYQSTVENYLIEKLTGMSWKKDNNVHDGKVFLMGEKCSNSLSHHITAYKKIASACRTLAKHVYSLQDQHIVRADKMRLVPLLSITYSAAVTNKRKAGLWRAGFWRASLWRAGLSNSPETHY